MSEAIDRIPPDSRQGRQLKRLDKLAWLLDDSIQIPGTKWRVGLDSVIGLVPGAGDIVTGLVSAFLVAEAVRAGAPGKTVVQMLINLGADLLAGTVPVVGDVFDAAWKANSRNVKLLREHLDPEPPGRRWMTGRGVVAALAFIGVLSVTALFVVAAIGIGQWLWATLTAL